LFLWAAAFSIVFGLCVVLFINIRKQKLIRDSEQAKHELNEEKSLLKQPRGVAE
jgi:hypothetical protein